METLSPNDDHDRCQLTDDEKAAIDRLVEESGYAKTARRLDVSLGVLMRAVSGTLGLRRGSVALIRQGLAGNP